MQRGCVRDGERRSSKHSVWRVKLVQVKLVCAEGHGSDSLSIFINPLLFYDIQDSLTDQKLGCECESRVDSIFNNCYALNYSTGCIQTVPEAKLNLIQYFIGSHPEAIRPGCSQTTAQVLTGIITALL